MDEPLGLGLKFDEIEEMIDEVLSLKSKSFANSFHSRFDLRPIFTNFE